MNVLLVYNRDIDINDAGASRTTIELANYLAEKDNIKVYAAFNILNGNNGKIVEIPVERDCLFGSYAQIIKEKQIDIIIVPEAIKLAEILSEAKKGTKAKIISALHTRPGYERIRLYVNFYEDLLLGKGLALKAKSIVKLLLYPFYYSRIKNDIINKMRRAYMVSDKLVLLSDHYKAPFIHSYNLNDGGVKLEAIPNGLSFGDLFIKEESLIKKQKYCLVVGRLDERSKRLSLLLRIWKEIEHKTQDWRLIVVGTGPSERLYKIMAKLFKLRRISFEGHQEPLDYYKQAKIFFMTSAFEGQPMTLLEAQPMGCVPIVMNTFEALADIVEDGVNGLVAKNKKEFLSKAITIMNDNVLLNKMALNGVNSCKKFERTRTYELYYKLIMELYGDSNY